MTLKEYSQDWVDTPEFHSLINDSFIGFVNNTPQLNEHRGFVEDNIMGFGERSFYWLHKLIVDEMPDNFKFLEIGVFRAQILSLYRILADMSGKKVTRYGVSPMDSSGIGWEGDYFADVARLHQQFNTKQDYTIYHGSSTDAKIIAKSQETAPYDMLFIDGSHEYEDVVSDLKHYAPLVKSGGYLLVDDAANRLHMEFGFFQGIQPVSDALYEWEQTELGKEFEFVFSVVHNMLFRRK